VNFGFDSSPCGLFSSLCRRIHPQGFGLLPFDSARPGFVSAKACTPEGRRRVRFRFARVCFFGSPPEARRRIPSAFPIFFSPATELSCVGFDFRCSSLPKLSRFLSRRATNSSLCSSRRGALGVLPATAAAVGPVPMFGRMC
jgi:hypothetical protein